MNLDPYLEFAHTLADTAGRIARMYFRTPYDVAIKKDATPVTIADREIEHALRALIRERFPSHGIIGEESDAVKPDAEYAWVLDPIDGTKAFMAGRPTFGVLIALCYQRVPILGIIDQPVNGERWVGAKDRPTLLNDQPVTVRPCSSLDRAVLATTSPTLFPSIERAAFESICKKIHYPIFGGDCYDYALLATGGIDLIIESGLKPYDMMALVPIIEGAGGIITDWEGDPITLDSDGHTLASGDNVIHSQVLHILNSVS